MVLAVVATVAVVTVMVDGRVLGMEAARVGSIGCGGGCNGGDGDVARYTVQFILNKRA